MHEVPDHLDAVTLGGPNHGLGEGEVVRAAARGPKPGDAVARGTRADTREPRVIGVDELEVSCALCKVAPRSVSSRVARALEIAVKHAVEQRRSRVMRGPDHPPRACNTRAR